MADSNFRPFEVNDFSLGITDDVFEQVYSQHKQIDNFLITSDKKILSRPGSEIDESDPAHDQIPAGNQRIGAMINYDNDDMLFILSARNVYWRDVDASNAYQTLLGPTSNSVFSTGLAATPISFTQDKKHLYLTNDLFPVPQKVYKDSSGDYQVRNSGLPALASEPSGSGTAGANDYLYAFHYEYTYMVGDQELEDVGAVTEISVASVNEPSVDQVAIISIPALVNGVTDNWDTTAIKVFIYRTLPGGTVFYKVGEVTNGTTTFDDSTSDADLVLGIKLYTGDGTLDYDAPPKSKFVHVAGGIGFYGYIDDGTSVFPSKIAQSIPGKPDACPQGLEVDLEDTLTGLSSVKSIPIALCKKKIYRLDGGFDQFGRGSLGATAISETAGCLSNTSIVQGEDGIFWAGQDGFYYSDGYKVIKISDGLNSTYKSILAESADTALIYGDYDDLDRKVMWAVQRDSASLDNDSFFILNARWGISPRSTFTTWSGTSFRPSSFVFFNSKLYRGDLRGYVFIHDELELTDPKVDTNEDAQDWLTETIIWTYESININFGSSFFRKYAPKVLIQAAGIANTTIQVTAVNDDGRSTRELRPIRWRRNFTWGDQEFFWRDPDCVWNNVGLIEKWLRFPARGLRVSYVRILISNGYAPITNSDVKGTATFAAVGNTATLDTVDIVWPEAAIDYFISTEYDDYEKQYQISGRTDTILTLFDSDNTLPNGSLEWVISGYKRGEPLNLLSYNIHWVDLSASQSPVTPSESGQNA